MSTISSFNKRIINAKRVYLDANPVIYLIDNHPDYFKSVKLVFDLIEGGKITAVTSLITSSEVLVGLMRRGQSELWEPVYERLTSGTNTEYVAILDEEASRVAAKLRSVNTSSLKLPDAQHLSLAIQKNCDIFLTNDKKLKNVLGLPPNLQVILIADLEQELGLEPENESLTIVE